MTTPFDCIESVDLDLVNKTIDLIPEQDWFLVRQTIIEAFVDNMPGAIMQQLTGSHSDFDKAEQILYCYYELPSCQEELIIDAFKIMGAVNCLELLNSLDFTQDELQAVQQQ
jgi:hypothetical protein